MNELISVIVPVYNVEKFIRQCLNSIISQTYKNIEIIIVNDGSKDDSLKICKEFQEKDNRIRLFNRKNSGVSESRNFGISVANGKYITFVDSDDYLENNAIEQLYKAIIEKNVDVVRCKVKIVKEEEVIYENLYELANKKLDIAGIRDSLYHFVSHKENISGYVYALIIKKEVIVRFNPTLFFMEDTEFYIRLFLNIKSIYFLNEDLYNYRYNPNSISKNTEKIKEVILGSIDSANEITKSIRRNEMLTLNLENKINTHVFNLMFLRLKVIANKKDVKKSQYFKEIFETPKVKKFIKTINKKELSKSKKIELFLIKNRLYRLLNIYVRITSIKK